MFVGTPCATQGSIPWNRPFRASDGPAPTMPTCFNATESRILIATDDPMEGLGLETVLRGDGYGQVRVTSDAREIAPLSAKWPFSLLLLDMTIRTQSCFVVIERLRPLMDRGALAIVALTAAGDELMQERALRAGALDVLARPFTRSEILLRTGAALRVFAGSDRVSLP